MLVTFRSPAAASVTMFGQNALQLLQMMGHSGKVPGAFYAEDLPARLKDLQQKLRDMDMELTNVLPDPAAEPKVSLKTRALPLIELMQKAIAKKQPVSWE